MWHLFRISCFYGYKKIRSKITGLTIYFTSYPIQLLFFSYSKAPMRSMSTSF